MKKKKKSPHLLVLLKLGFLFLNSLLSILIEIKIIQDTLFAHMLLEYLEQLNALIKFNLYKTQLIR